MPTMRPRARSFTSLGCKELTGAIGCRWGRRGLQQGVAGDPRGLRQRQRNGLESAPYMHPLLSHIFSTTAASGDVGSPVARAS